MLVYSDNAGNIKKAVRDLRLAHEFSLPGVPKSNGLIERYVGDVLQGTRTYLVQAGLPICFWPYASQCYVFCYNVFGQEYEELESQEVLEKEEDVVDPAKADIYVAAPAIKEPGGDHSVVMGKDEAEIVVT